MTKVILMDIEGTTTSVSFVHDVLFPYSKEHLEEFIKRRASDADVRAYLTQVRQTMTMEANKENPPLVDMIAQLKAWIAADRKHPALKGLQGLIWENGYREKKYTSHIYPEVSAQLKQWHADGLILAIYSSGSIHAQKLLFGHTPDGDLTPLFRFYFDTGVGGKREVQSYCNIAETIGVPPQEILFLSDIGEELDAAAVAGMQTMQLLRPGTKAYRQHPTAANFIEVERIRHAAY